LPPNLFCELLLAELTGTVDESLTAMLLFTVVAGSVTAADFPAKLRSLSSFFGRPGPRFCNCSLVAMLTSSLCKVYEPSVSSARVPRLTSTAAAVFIASIESAASVPHFSPIQLCIWFSVMPPFSFDTTTSTVDELLEPLDDNWPFCTKLFAAWCIRFLTAFNTRRSVWFRFRQLTATAAILSVLVSCLRRLGTMR